MPIECYRKILSLADNEEIREGKAWYRKARKEIEKISIETQTPMETCCGVVAVLSPMVEWGINLRAAKRFIRTKGKSRGAGYKANYHKAREVLKGNFEVVRGPKVSRFFRTLLDPSFPEPVIDSQMIGAWYYSEIDPSDIKKINNSEKRLSLIRNAVEELSKERNENTAQTQATIWITFKRLKGKYCNQLKLWS